MPFVKFALKNINVVEFHFYWLAERSSERCSKVALSPPSLRFGAAVFALRCRSERRLVGWQGLEPWTNALKGHCSTN